MATTGNVSALQAGGNLTSHSGTLTIGSEARRKVNVYALLEASQTVTGATFDGAAMTGFGGTPDQHPSDSTQRIWSFYYDVPSGTSSGVKNVVVTTAGATNSLSWYATEILDAADGAPESSVYASGGTATATVTSTADAALVGAAIIAAATQDITVTGDVTGGVQLNEAGFTTRPATASAVSAGSRSMVAAGNGGSNCGCRLASYAAYSAPPATRRPTFLRAVRRVVQRYAPTRLWTGATKVVGGGIMDYTDRRRRRGWTPRA